MTKTQNGINTQALNFSGFISLTSTQIVPITQLGIGSGNADLYTVPANKRLILVGWTFFNTAGTATTVTFQLKSGGVYYQLAPSASVATVSNTTDFSLVFIFEAGESVSLNTSQAGINAWFNAILYDSSCAMYSPRVLALAKGDNTIYTVPVGKTARLFESCPTANQSVSYFNLTAGARTISLYAIPNGASKTNDNALVLSKSCSNNTLTSFYSSITLSAGDSILINTNAATASQTAWLNVMEF